MREHPIITLAKSDRYQFLYKEYLKRRLKLFKNNMNLTYIQEEFLKWLEIIKIIKEDIDSKETYAYEEILDDFIRLQAYLVYKSRKIKDKMKNPERIKKKNKDRKLDERIILTR